jgi:hypothetical protein
VLRRRAAELAAGVSSVGMLLLHTSTVTPCGRVGPAPTLPQRAERACDAGVRVGHVAGAPGRVGAACGGGVGGRRRRAAGGVRRRRAAGACCAGVRQSLQRV